MVEFALALPVLLLLIYGLIETSRLIFTVASVNSASREAARYGSAAGIASTGSTTLTYQDCAGIRDAARRVGFLLGLSDNQILIYHDTGPQSTATQYCLPGNSTDTSVTLVSGNRVLVNVTAQWTLLVPILPFQSRTISSGNTARTFMGVIEISTP